MFVASACMRSVISRICCATASAPAVAGLTLRLQPLVGWPYSTGPACSRLAPGSGTASSLATVVVARSTAADNAPALREKSCSMCSRLSSENTATHWPGGSGFFK